MNLPKNTPKELDELFRAMAADFPVILSGNLVGIYLWGSLTYDAFDERCSDVDCVVVTNRDLGEREFFGLAEWFRRGAKKNRWVERIDMRFVINHEFLDKTSRCCGFYPHTGNLVRHGSDGNPIIWMNVAQCGVTLWGEDAMLIAPQVPDRCFTDALLLELNYLKEDLNTNAGDRSDRAFIHNAYAVLTACRILYSACHRTLVSKERACCWAMDNVPSIWHRAIEEARENRLKSSGSTTPELERIAICFVNFVAGEVGRIVERPGQT